MTDRTQALVHSQPRSLAAPSDAALALAERAKADALARYQVAMMMPRDMDQVRRDLLFECERISLADQAEYGIKMWNSRTQKNETVTGPSIRLAEAVARALGSIDTEQIVVAEDADTRTLRVSATDLQRNVRFSGDVVVRKTAERRKTYEGQEILGTRQNSEGKPVYIVRVDDGTMHRQQQAAVSKILRNNLLRLLPGGLLDEAIDVCRATRAKRDKADPDAQRKKVTDAFAALGVEPAELAAHLGHPLAQCSPKQIDYLRKVYAAVNDGQTTWAEIRRQQSEEQDAVGQENPTQSKAAKVREKVKARKTAPLPVQPCIGEHEGVRLHTWVQHGADWRGEWSIPDEDLAGEVIVRDSEILESQGPEPDDRVRAAVAWAFEVTT